MTPNNLPLLRTSERTSFTQCRQRWQWSWVDQLKPKEEVPALRFGDLVHRALAAYYIPGRKRGPAPAATFERLYHEQIEEHKREGFNVWSDDNWQNALHLGVGMLERYVVMYEERDKRYQVIQSEIQFRFPLRRAKGKAPIAIQVGTIDGLWKDLEPISAKRPYIFAEHKTTTSISLDGLPLDEQAGTYWTYGPAYMVRAGLFDRPDQINGIMYNYLRKALPSADKTQNASGHYLNKPTKEVMVQFCVDKNVNGWAGLKVDELVALIDKAKGAGSAARLGEVSKVQPAPFWHREMVFRDLTSRQRVHERVLEQVDEILKARAGKMAVYKIPGPLHNPNCRGCSFRDMCELHETGNDWTAMRDSEYTVWEPYSEHEIASGERK